MKLSLQGLLALGVSLVLTACATIAPPQPPSLELPKPPSDLRAARKGDRVLLTWTAPTVTTERQRARSIGPTLICRALELESKCGTPVGEAAAPTDANPASPTQGKVVQSYTDSLAGQLRDNPSAFITYAVEALNAAGRGAGLSNHVRVSLAPTIPPPKDFAARVSSEGVVLTWRSNIPAVNPVEPVHYVDRIYRTLAGSQEQVFIGERSSGGESSYTDSSIEWEATYEYRAETVTLIAEDKNPQVQIQGEDTSAIKVFAHDVFAPAVPSGLQAVASGPGQKTFVDLVWAPVSDADFDGYNVFRHEDGTAPKKVNAELLKTPAYRDTSVASGKKYFYAVSAVDIRGNESAVSQEASESVP